MRALTILLMPSEQLLTLFRKATLIKRWATEAHDLDIPCDSLRIAAEHLYATCDLELARRGYSIAEREEFNHVEALET